MKASAAQKATTHGEKMEAREREVAVAKELAVDVGADVERDKTRENDF